MEKDKRRRRSTSTMAWNSGFLGKKDGLRTGTCLIIQASGKAPIDRTGWGAFGSGRNSICVPHG